VVVCTDTSTACAAYFASREVREIGIAQHLVQNIHNWPVLITILTDLDKVKVLESLECAQNVEKDFTHYLEDRQVVNLVISGAGFTGIELACNLYDICKKRGKKINVTMVEVAKKILPMISEKSRSHILDKLHKLEFNINTGNQVKTFDGKNITLSSGEVINDVFFCWCSGVMASLKPTGCYDTLPDGRILVDEFLSIPKYPEVFVVGDAAAMKDKNNNILRRAVTFAQMSGKNAGKNIALRIDDNEGEVFNPIDLGWIIPMYITSVGVVLGVQVRGHKGIFMHYIICGIKNYNFKNLCTEFLAAFKYTFVKTR